MLAGVFCRFFLLMDQFDMCTKWCFCHKLAVVSMMKTCRSPSLERFRLAVDLLSAEQHFVIILLKILHLSYGYTSD